ncbi:MAG: recombination protein RecR [Rickettsiales bacterium]|nr:recombination protein RecR [Rickettsiales bacterium]|tara:strand:+ start:1528 stop:2124 length:597 start_codon:yes stop_codon:yes gene_type:complete
MADAPSDPLTRLVHHLSRLPGIGSRSATRLAYHIVRDGSIASDLAEALVLVDEQVGRCSLCCDISASDPCKLCLDPRRDSSLICVVERTQDLRALERTGEFRGRYHVLEGALSPLDGIGPEELRISELLARIENDVEEVILATNATVSGDATALYLSRLLKPLGLKVSRIARGVSVGAELEYTDSSTLLRALEERREI